MELQQELLSPRKLKNPKKFQKLVNKNSSKKLSPKASFFLQKLILLYVKDGIKRSAEYAEKQAKDYIDGECFTAIEEKLRMDYG